MTGSADLAMVSSPMVFSLMVESAGMTGSAVLAMVASPMVSSIVL